MWCSPFRQSSGCLFTIVYLLSLAVAHIAPVSSATASAQRTHLRTPKLNAVAVNNRRSEIAFQASPALLCVGDFLTIRGSVESDSLLSLWLAGQGGTVLGEHAIEIGSSVIMAERQTFQAGFEITTNLINAAIAAEAGTTVPFDVRACTFRLDDGALNCSNSVTVRKLPDACGVCGGDGNSCRGCDGLPNSGKVFDECGVCGGNNFTCQGCDGVPNSGKELDVCDVCDGDGTSCLGCDGKPNSGKIVDACGECGGRGSSCAGCDGVPNSGKEVDSCGTCGGNDNSCAFPYVVTAPAEACQNQSQVRVSWVTPSNRNPRGQLCLFKEGFTIPHSCENLVGRVSGEVVWGQSSVWGNLAQTVGTRLSFSISKSCGMSQVVDWTQGRCATMATSSALVIGEAADPCGICGGDGTSCAGCDGVPNSGEVLDTCGTCGGTDMTCDDPVVVIAQEHSVCLGPNPSPFELTVLWTGPSDHSLFDRIGVFGPEPLRDVWSGGCADGSGACTSDADCGSSISCDRFHVVGAGSSGTVVVDVTPTGLPPVGAAVATAGLDMVVRYLGCRGDVQLGLCQGYAVESEAAVRVRVDMDPCGVCGGNGSTCSGCDGVPNSGLESDACGVCGGDNSTCAGCDGKLGSGLTEDACGECGGDNSTCAGCDGVPYSGKEVDKCGVCGGTSDCPILEPSTAVYCLGDAAVGPFRYQMTVERRQGFVSVRNSDLTWNEVSLLRQSSACNACAGPCTDPADTPPSCFPSGCPGCPSQGDLTIVKAMLPPRRALAPGMELQLVLGVTLPDGALQQTAIPLHVQGERDLCGVCGGDGLSCVACDGIPFSPAVVDQCGNCTVPGSPSYNQCLGCDGTVGGNLVEDVCGVCGGNGLSCLDCEGVPNGDAELDSCGECGGSDDSCDGSYSLSTGQVSRVCAGDNVQVFSRAPFDHSTDNRVAMFYSGLQDVPVSGLARVDAGPRGQFEFATDPEWFSAGLSSHVEFRYLLSPLSSFVSPVAVSPPILLQAPSDQCGVCGGNNSACKGCDGVPNSGLRLDLCGVCGGPNACLDCANVPDGPHLVDRCGQCAVPVRVCASGTNADMTCRQDQDCGADGSCKVTDQNRDGWNECVDCFGVVDGKAEVDSCGTCGGTDNSCAAGYAVTPDRDEFCLGQPLVAQWRAPSIRRTGNLIGYSRVSADGYTGPILGWSYVDPQDSLGEDVYSPRSTNADNRGVVIGRSYYLVPGDPREGLVLFNRSSLAQEPTGCPGCLVGSQFLRPSEPGVYQFVYFYSISSPEKAAESRTFRVGQPADVCGVCGGNNRACAGCDGVPNSGKTYDVCGVCGGSNACVGCDGRPFSNARLDICGVCQGNARSCTGCDGIARPGGGLKEDSCGVCGGHDRSCGLPPSVGTVPSMFDYVCAKPTVEVWWRAPSNRSRDDYIELCPRDVAASLKTCVIALDTFTGSRGQQVLQLPQAMATPRWYELRYFSRVLGSNEFVLAASHEYDATSNPMRCALLEYAVRPDQFEFCIGQDITVRFRVPPSASSQALKKAIIGVVRGTDPYGDPCAACEARGVPCMQCYARVCRGTEECTLEGVVTLPGDDEDAVALASPNVAGEFRPCFYATYTDFRKGSPVMCGEDFAIVAGQVDECGVCGGDGLSCLGCDDNPFSGEVYDVCGVCGGNGTSCLGCDGFANSDTVEDECGICGGDGSTCAGCDDVPNSGKVLDSCGMCGGDDGNCLDPYTIVVDGGCVGEAASVRWTAPSNHSAMRVSVSNNATGLACALTWAMIENSTDDRTRWVSFSEGFSGCGAGCTRGVAFFTLLSQHLAECGTGNAISTWTAELMGDGQVLASLQNITWISDCQRCSPFFGAECETPVTTTVASEPTTPPPSPPPAATVDFGSALRLSFSLELVIYWRPEIEESIATAATAQLGKALTKEQVKVDAVCRPDGSLCQWFGVVKTTHPFYITATGGRRHDEDTHPVADSSDLHNVPSHLDGGDDAQVLSASNRIVFAGNGDAGSDTAARRGLLQADGNIEYRSAILFTVTVAQGTEADLQNVLFSSSFPAAFAAALSAHANRTVHAALPTWGLPTDSQDIPLLSILLGAVALLLVLACGLFVYQLRQNRLSLYRSDDDPQAAAPRRPARPQPQAQPQLPAQPSEGPDDNPPQPSRLPPNPVVVPPRRPLHDETQSVASELTSAEPSRAPAAGIVQFAMSLFSSMQSPAGATPLPSPHKHVSPLPSPAKGGRPAGVSAGAGAGVGAAVETDAAGARLPIEGSPAPKMSTALPPSMASSSTAASTLQHRFPPMGAAASPKPMHDGSPAATSAVPASQVSPVGPTSIASPSPPQTTSTTSAPLTFRLPLPKKYAGSAPGLPHPARTPTSPAHHPASSALPLPLPRMTTPATPGGRMQSTLTRPPASSTSSRASLSPIVPPGSAQTPITSVASLSLSPSPPAAQQAPQPDIPIYARQPPPQQTPRPGPTPGSVTTPPPPAAASANPFANDGDDDEWGGWDGNVGWDDDGGDGGLAGVPTAPQTATNTRQGVLVPRVTAPTHIALPVAGAASSETKGVLSPRAIPAPAAKPTAEIGAIRIGKGVLGGKAGKALDSRSAASGAARGGLGPPPSKAGLPAPAARSAQSLQQPLARSVSLPIPAAPAARQPQPPPAAAPTDDGFGNFDDDDDFGDWATPEPEAPPSQRKTELLQPWERDGMVCVVEVKRDPQQPAKVHLAPRFSNSTAQAFTSFVCKIAVPKHIGVTMGQLSGSVVLPHRGNSVTTPIDLENPVHKPGQTFKLQLRVEFMVGDQARNYSIPYRI